MNEQNYKLFLEILYDYGGFDPVLLHNCNGGKSYDFKVNKFKRINDFQKKHGSARPILKRPENSKFWGEYYEFYHAVLKQEDWELYKTA